MNRMGIDVGNTAVKTVVLDGAGAIRYVHLHPHEGSVARTLCTELDRCRPLLAGSEFLLGCTGSQARQFDFLHAHFVNGVPATVEGALLLVPETASIMEIGAQQAKFITGFSGNVKKNLRFSTNTSCAAGTGAFLEEQASRLEISLDELSEYTESAERVPRIAGRCSVFSKTDMIHHQQEGATVPDILLGLVYAMVRNFKANVVGRQEVAGPVMLLGGVMRINGVVTALREVFRLSQKETLLPEHFLFAGALGAASNTGVLLPACDMEGLIDRLKHPAPRSDGRSDYPCLKSFGESDARKKQVCAPAPRTVKGSLGIDVGSTSVNLVLVDEARQVLAYRYLRTKGRPEKVVEEGLRDIRKEIGSGLTLLGMGTTGSGRHFLGKKLAVDLVVNEISAQARGAVHVDREVDTIFEIGGQDSKYIRIENETVVDFEMNKICAAGTGSFLEAQAEKIGVPLQRFGEAALAGAHPIDLGDRCTVFIEGSISKALAAGAPREDIVAGLSYAIVHNYLNRVVGHRPIGERILLQGGIAHNQAVVNAFRAVLKKPILVPPFFSVTGALGAAILTLEKKRERPVEKRPTSRVDDFWQAAKKEFLKGYTGEIQKDRLTVGIPRVLFMHKLFVLFNEYFKTLGFNVVLSDATTPDIVHLSRENVLEETCYPVKLVNGHVAALMEKGIDILFLPSVFTMKHENSKVRKDYACTYMQQVSALMSHGMALEKHGVRLISPRISFKFGKRYMAKTIFRVGRKLGKSRFQTARAMKNGFLRLREYNRRLEDLGKTAIDSLRDNEVAFVVITRPYGVNDPELNMGIPDKLMDMGYKVLSISALPVGRYDTFEAYPNMFWPFGQHIMAAAQIIRRHPKLYAVFLTNHGCGPDLMLAHYFEKEMKGKPYLHLEVDEHSSDVGVTTRLEAFVNSFKKKIVTPPATLESASDGPAPQKLFIPYAWPHSHLACEVLRNNGTDAHVLPRTDSESFEKGRQLCFSKEYLSLVSLLGDVCRQVEKSNGQPIRFWIPSTEGSEISGQYEKLIDLHLASKGGKAAVESPFVEDLLTEPDYGMNFVHAMVGADVIMAADPSTRTVRLQELIHMVHHDELTREHLLALAADIHARNDRTNGRPSLLLVGENRILFNPFNNHYRVEFLEKKCRLLYQPVSEMLYCLWRDLEKFKKSPALSEALDWLCELLRMVSETLGDSGAFSPDPNLLVTDADKGLPLFSSGNGRYRYAKMRCHPRHLNGIVAMESMYQNSGTVVRQLLERQPNGQNVPVLYLTFDGSTHGDQEELVRNFLHYL